MRRTLQAGTVAVQIGGNGVCLKAGQTRVRRLDARYRVYGLDWAMGRLIGIGRPS